MLQTGTRCYNNIIISVLRTYVTYDHPKLLSPERTPLTALPSRVRPVNAAHCRVISDHAKRVGNTKDLLELGLQM